MPTLDAEITNIVQGDKIDINVTVSELPGAITKAWFTVKTREQLSSSTVDVGNFVFQKVITTVNQVGTGYISDDGTTDGIAAIRIDLRNADTVLLSGGTLYFFDLQVLQSGEPYTPWSGIIKTVRERTKSTS